MLNFDPKDLGDILKQAQTMQKNITDAQENLKKKMFVGQAGGDLVTITLDGGYGVVSVKFHPDALKEKPEVVGTLTEAALRKALDAIQSETKGALGGIMQGIDLPPELREITG